MSVADTLPTIPDALRPTSLRTALVALPLAVLLAYSIGVIVQDFINPLIADFAVGIGSFWYLSRQTSPSDAAGVGLLAFVIPLLLFPITAFLLPLFTDGPSEIFVNIIGVVVTAGVALLLALICVILSFLLLRHGE